MMGRLVATHESPRAQPWRMELPDDYMDRMIRAIVGFEIEITRLEGKLKLSQNRSDDDRRRVTAALAESGEPLDRAVAELMRDSG